MLDWLFSALIVCVALGLGALCAPMTFALHCRREAPSWEWAVRLSFFWSGLGVGLRWGPKGLCIAPVLLGQFLPALPLRSQVQRGQRVWRQAKQKAAPKVSAPNLRSLAHLLFKPSLRFLASLPRIIRFKKLRLQGRLGFADPAQTGRIYGYLQAVAANQKKVQINVSPDFVRTGAFGRLDLVAHLHLGLLMLLLGRLGAQVTYRVLAVRFRTPT